MKMDITVRKMLDVTILDFNGRMIFEDDSAVLHELMRGLLGEGRKKILFNLGKINYIDSSGLGQLVSAYTSISKVNGTFKLLNPTKHVLDLLQITRLDTVFEIMENEECAVDSFAQTAAAHSCS